MTENYSSDPDSETKTPPTFDEHDLRVSTEDGRHVPKVLYDVQWHFQFERDEWITPTDHADDEQEWPYWKIDTKLLNADAYVRMYQIRSTHPKTRSVRYELVSEVDLIDGYERVDSEQVRAAASKLPETPDETA